MSIFIEADKELEAQDIVLHILQMKWKLLQKEEEEKNI